MNSVRPGPFGQLCRPDNFVFGQSGAVMPKTTGPKSITLKETSSYRFRAGRYSENRVKVETVLRVLSWHIPYSL